MVPQFPARSRAWTKIVCGPSASALNAAWDIVAVSVAVWPPTTPANDVPELAGPAVSMKYSAATTVLVAPMAEIAALIDGGALMELPAVGVPVRTIVGAAVSFSKLRPLDHGPQLPAASSPSTYSVCVPSGRALKTVLEIATLVSVTVLADVIVNGLLLPPASSVSMAYSTATTVLLASVRLAESRGGVLVGVGVRLLSVAAGPAMS